MQNETKGGKNQGGFKLNPRNVLKAGLLGLGFGLLPKAEGRVLPEHGFNEGMLETIRDTVDAKTRDNMLYVVEDDEDDNALMRYYMPFGVYKTENPAIKSIARTGEFISINNANIQKRNELLSAHPGYLSGVLKHEHLHASSRADFTLSSFVILDDYQSRAYEAHKILRKFITSLPSINTGEVNRLGEDADRRLKRGDKVADLELRTLVDLIDNFKITYRFVQYNEKSDLPGALYFATEVDNKLHDLIGLGGDKYLAIFNGVKSREDLTEKIERAGKKMEEEFKKIGIYIDHDSGRGIPEEYQGKTITEEEALARMRAKQENPNEYKGILESVTYQEQKPSFNDKVSEKISTAQQNEL